jgi:hypothetical protein
MHYIIIKKILIIYAVNISKEKSISRSIKSNIILFYDNQKKKKKN